jgi:hypothetical protein
MFKQKLKIEKLKQVIKQAECDLLKMEKDALYKYINKGIDATHAQQN